jgi:hypothetical protein
VSVHLRLDEEGVGELVCHDLEAARAEQPGELEQAWRASGALPVSSPRLERGATGSGPRAPLALRDASHVRLVLDRSGRLSVRAFAAHGYVAGDARPDVWAHAPGCTRSRSFGAQTRSFGHGVGTRPKRPRSRNQWQSRLQSGRRDLNSGPLVPQTSALTRLRHAPWRPNLSRSLRFARPRPLAGPPRGRAE